MVAAADTFDRSAGTAAPPSLRGYPLFAFLFGYGMMQLFLRQTAAGTTEREAVALLRRRSLWLIAFGVVHAALLMAGDILGSYGLASLWLG